MNNTRRKQIQLIINALQDNLNHLEALKQEEEESFDNLPESLQESERARPWKMPSAIWMMPSLTWVKSSTIWRAQWNKEAA